MTFAYFIFILHGKKLHLIQEQEQQSQLFVWQVITSNNQQCHPRDKNRLVQTIPIILIQRASCKRGCKEALLRLLKSIIIVGHKPLIAVMINGMDGVLSKSIQIGLNYCSVEWVTMKVK